GAASGCGTARRHWTSASTCVWSVATAESSTCSAPVDLAPERGRPSGPPVRACSPGHACSPRNACIQTGDVVEARTSRQVSALPDACSFDVSGLAARVMGSGGWLELAYPRAHGDGP